MRPQPVRTGPPLALNLRPRIAYHLDSVLVWVSASCIALNPSWSSHTHLGFTFLQKISVRSSVGWRPGMRPYPVMIGPSYILTIVMPPDTAKTHAVSWYTNEPEGNGLLPHPFLSITPACNRQSDASAGVSVREASLSLTVGPSYLSVVSVFDTIGWPLVSLKGPSVAGWSPHSPLPLAPEGWGEMMTRCMPYISISSSTHSLGSGPPSRAFFPNPHA